MKRKLNDILKEDATIGEALVSYFCVFLVGVFIGVLVGTWMMRVGG